MSAAKLKPATLAKLAALLASPAVRSDVYRTVRRAFKGVRALCAATASEYLIRAGVLSGYHPWTSGLEVALKVTGWKTVGGTGVTARDNASTGETPVPPLKPYDVCYTTDANANGAPDHVFIFLRWLDQSRLVAEVVDNYGAHPHPRNLGAPVWYGGQLLARTPFSQAQRLG